MLRFILRRMAQMVPLLIGITFLSFVVVDLAPGDFFDTLAMNPSISPELVKEMKAEFGYGQPLPIRYARWLWRAAHFDLGVSVNYRVPVADLIAAERRQALQTHLEDFLRLPLGQVVAVILQAELRRQVLRARDLGAGAFQHGQHQARRPGTGHQRVARLGR